jgi:serine protease inhibitor
VKKYASTISFLSVVSLYLLAMSCKKDTTEILPSDPVRISLSPDQVTLIESENNFAFDIFRKVIQNSGETENLIISPLSISYALSMTLNGANGATRDSILKAIGLAGITPDKINNSYRELTKAILSVDKRVLISIANSVWTENDFEVKKAFIKILTDYYSAESGSFDIADPGAPGKMNAWIEAKTNGLIKNMINRLDDNTVMLLINAIYFKGKWKSQFDSNNTVQASFYKAGGAISKVAMMKQTSDFKVYTGQGFVLAEFPYGQGNFVMDVILPDDVNGLSGILPLLNISNFKTWLNQMQLRETRLSFPSFKYGYKEQLNEILKKMGMGVAFSDIADFSNISNQSLRINEVIHQAFIETNEEGTEAAAATVVVIGTTAMPLSFNLNIDHPFIYIIRETTTNSVIFMGRVTDPLLN